MSSPLQDNIANLQSVLDIINTLPDEITLPELTNPGDASKVLLGYEFIDSGCQIVTGTIPDNGIISVTMDGVDIKSVDIPIGYTSGGIVSLDNTIDTAVDNALSALVEKGVEVPEGAGVSGLAELIGAIETGGNILDCSYAAGSFTVAQDCIKYNIMSLSDLETLFDGILPTKSVGGYWLANGYTTTDSNSAFFGLGASASSANYLNGSPHYISGSSVTRGSITTVIGFTGLEGLYVQSYSNAGFRAGTTYNWILIKIQ